MQIEVFPSGPIATNTYLVICPNTRQAAIIDAAPGCAGEIIPFIEENSLIPTKLLLTHSHWDHIADSSNLKDNYPALEIYIHSDDVPNLENPGSDRLPTMNIKIKGIRPDKLIKEGDTFTVGEVDFKVIHTPGHTPGCVCFYCPEYGILFTGDTLFRGSIGSLAFPTAQPEKMWPSLTKLSKLPPNTVVHPGHGPGTTIGTEKWLANARDVFGD